MIIRLSSITLKISISSKDILKELLVLVTMITFIVANLKDCLIKELILLKHLTIELLHT